MADEKWTVADTDEWALSGLEGIRAIFADDCFEACAFILATREPHHREPLDWPGVLHLRPKEGLCCARARGVFARRIERAIRELDALAYLVAGPAWMACAESDDEAAALRELAARSPGKGQDGWQPVITALYQRNGVTRPRAFFARIEGGELGAFTEDTSTNLTPFVGLFPVVQ